MCDGSAAAWLVESQVIGSKIVDEIFHGNQGLSLDEMSSNGLEFIGLGGKLAERASNLRQGLLPSNRNESVGFPDQGGGESLSSQSITGKSSLIIDPLLINVVVQPGQNAHDFHSTGVHANIRSQSIQNIDRFSMLQLPRPCSEGIWFRRQGAYGTQIDNVTRQFTIQVLFQISANLHLVSSAGGPQLRGTCYVICKAHTACAVDASVHRSLDQRSNILILHSTLAAYFVEPSTIRAISHRLVLQVAFASLVADRAVQGVVGEEEFHDAFSCFVCEGGIGLDDHSWLDWPCT